MKQGQSCDTFTILYTGSAFSWQCTGASGLYSMVPHQVCFLEISFYGSTSWRWYAIRYIRTKLVFPGTAYGSIELPMWMDAPIKDGPHFLLYLTDWTMVVSASGDEVVVFTLKSEGLFDLSSLVFCRPGGGNLPVAGMACHPVPSQATPHQGSLGTP